jgi:hypothetical protein
MGKHSHKGKRSHKGKGVRLYSGYPGNGVRLMSGYPIMAGSGFGVIGHRTCAQGLGMRLGGCSVIHRWKKYSRR